MKQWLLNRLGLTEGITIKVYRGFGHAHKLHVYGHVLGISTDQKPHRNTVWRNMRLLLGLFFMKPLAGMQVRLQWGNRIVSGVTEKDGFFSLEWSADGSVPAGEHAVTVVCYNEAGGELARCEGRLVVPHITQLGIISDIDDTFLVSYSATRLKRLVTLLGNNARSRKAFDDVARHYQLLQFAQNMGTNPNPFFYISSSEWNLYSYLREFLQVQKLPEGVLLLNQLKRWNQILKTGKTRHQGKFARIVRVMEAFPEQAFLLMGDNSQQDPLIYASVARHFPGRIKAVYIRSVVAKNNPDTEALLQPLIQAGIPCCLFRESKNAIAHSRAIGLIPDSQ
jgi:phosphatidate phosphatase APP1